MRVHVGLHEFERRRLFAAEERGAAGLREQCIDAHRFRCGRARSRECERSNQRKGEAVQLRWVER